MVNIGQNTEKSPGDVSRLVVIQTPVKDYQFNTGVKNLHRVILYYIQISKSGTIDSSPYVTYIFAYVTVYKWEHHQCNVYHPFLSGWGRVLDTYCLAECFSKNAIRPYIILHQDVLACYLPYCCKFK